LSVALLASIANSGRQLGSGSSIWQCEATYRDGKKDNRHLIDLARRRRPPMPNVMNRDFGTSLLKKGIPRWLEQPIPDRRGSQRVRTAVHFYSGLLDESRPLSRHLDNGHCADIFELPSSADFVAKVVLHWGPKILRAVGAVFV
jgi:hypothetical protein